MKNAMFLFAVSIIFLSNCLRAEVVEAAEDVRIILFVSSENGLNVRESPSVNSMVLHTLPHGTLVSISQKTSEKYTIDGMNDYWYFAWVEAIQRRGWVFGGYLTDRFEAKPLVGRWVREDDSIQQHTFYIDGSFREWLRGRGPNHEGRYEWLENNTVRFFYYFGVGDMGIEVRPRDATIEFIDDNTFRRIDGSGETTWIRDNSW